MPSIGLGKVVGLRLDGLAAALTGLLHGLAGLAPCVASGFGWT